MIQHHMDGRIARASSGSSDGAAARAGSSQPKSSATSLTNQEVGATSSNSHNPPIKCPRCNSLNTKFCYYNNYSQTQPRHFCKSCRRYWTEGGALRNVPVGGGCRKNKRVKQRPLINLGPASALLDPSALIDETTSNMLARLSNTSPFPNLMGNRAPSFCGDDTSTQLLNIAFSRFQESMRLHQQHPLDQSPETSPDFDMSFPALIHKQSTSSPCSCGACGSGVRSIHHHGPCDGVMSSFQNANMGFQGLPIKMGHDVGMAGFCSSGFELNPIYHDQSAGLHMVGTSATATLASIEDQLSSFSNLQHVDTFNGDVSTDLVEDKLQGHDEGSMRNMVTGPLQLLGHVEKGADTMESAFGDDIKERVMHINMFDDKQLLSTVNNELSLNMMQATTDSGWQQPPPLMMNEMMFEPHHSMWNSHGTSRSWQDNIHSLAATSAATGSAL